MKYNLVVFVLTLGFTFSNENNERIFQIGYLYIDDAYYFFAKITSEKDSLLFGLDLTSQYTRIAQENIEIPVRNSTSIIGDSSLVISDFVTLNGVERRDLLSIGGENGDESQINISLVNTLPHSQFYGKNNVIALANKLHSKTHSVIHQLKDKGVIDKACFSFSTNQTNGILYIGGVPSDITDSFYQISFNVLGKVNNWDCALTHVFIDNISYIYENSYHIVEEPTYFSSTQTFIEVPNHFYQRIITEVFNQTLEQRRCVRKNYGNNEIECQCNIIKDFKPITFVIDGIAFLFKSEELFLPIEAICTFQIVSNLNDNHWILGITFTKKYITTFDYDNNKVIFHSKEQFTKVNLDSLFPTKKILKWVLIIGSITLLIVIIKIVQIIMRKKKVNRHQKAIEDVYQSL